MNAAVTAIALMLPASDDLPPLTPAASQDARLAALERRVAELCERLDRPAPSAGGTEAQSATTNFVAAPQAAYTAACGPNGCGLAPATGPTFTALGGPPGAYFSGPYGAVTGPAFGGGCSGGSCGAAAPAGGLLRGGLFGRRR
jgi:hypothetical protein